MMRKLRHKSHANDSYPHFVCKNIKGNKRTSVLRSTGKYREVPRSTEKSREVPRSPVKYGEVQEVQKSACFLLENIQNIDFCIHNFASYVFDLLIKMNYIKIG